MARSKAPRYRSAGVLVLAILVSQLAGIAGSVFTFDAIPVWYASLQKPFAPPAWIFAPVWLILYTLMGIALWLVWKKSRGRKPYLLFGIQLFLNALWSVIFFGLKNPGLALAEIVALWVAVALTAKEFYKVEKRAGWLLLPYIAWLTIALLLNAGIWALNP